ncbi:MAG: DNA repair ATPase [Spirochaetota bacterium]
MTDDTQVTTDETPTPPDSETELAGGSYEIIKKRLRSQSDVLLERVNKLNAARKDIFGALDNHLLAQDRILTDNNCIPRDMQPLGNLLLFGYQVVMGLKKSAKVEDVFSVYEFKDNSFHQLSESFLGDKSFVRDFLDLYNYFRESLFSTFYKDETRLLMVFQVGKKAGDIRVFKWSLNTDGSLTYVNNRAEREVPMPPQHDFDWHRTTRDMHRSGRHPHISIDERVFVETVGGDLTVKIEDNTNDGSGIYSEDVNEKDQTLDDAEIHYAILEHMILLKIKPYREESFRYLIYNEKTQKASRIDDIEQCAIRLPEDDGLIFPRGYYLESGEYKRFDLETAHMRYRNTIRSSNGEDFLYIFYNDELGEYVLLQYNIIEKKVELPIHCHGYSIYNDGKMVYFKSDNEPKRNHGIQIWQTPFVHEEKLTQIQPDNELARIGNKDLVRGISDLRSIYHMLRTDNIYLGLYQQIVKRVTNTLDFHHWLDKKETFQPKEILQEINQTSKDALEEYEKVVQIRKSTENALRSTQGAVADLIRSIEGRTYATVDEYVSVLATLQKERGKTISLRDLRYIDIASVEDLETQLGASYEKVAGNCVDFLLTPSALTPLIEKLKTYESSIDGLEKSKEMEELQEQVDSVNESLNLLTELVNNLQIEDATQTTTIIDSISEVYTHVNQLRAQLKNKMHELHSGELAAEFEAQFKLLNQTASNFLENVDTLAQCEESMMRIMVQLEELEGKFSDFDEYIDKLSEKREEIYSAFNNRKVQLQESINRKSNNLWKSADRILNSISNRLKQLKDIEEMHAYFAGDTMVHKVQDIVKKLAEFGDSVKSEDIAGRLKSLQQEGSRQLKDKKDLFADGENVISLGGFKFLTNNQSVDLTTVQRDEHLYFHLTGTEFFEKIEDEEFATTKSFWNLEWISETHEIYRSEYLAYKFLHACETSSQPLTVVDLHELTRKAHKAIHAKNASKKKQASTEFKELLNILRTFSRGSYEEGYQKGVHDMDAVRILVEICPLYFAAKTLRYHPTTRALANLFWKLGPKSKSKTLLGQKVKSFGLVRRISETTAIHPEYIEQLREQMQEYFQNLDFVADPVYLKAAADYLFEELMNHPQKEPEYFPVNKKAFALYLGFRDFLQEKKSLTKFDATIKSLGGDIGSRLSIVRDWVTAYVSTLSTQTDSANPYLMEAIFLVLQETLDNRLDGDIKESSVQQSETSAEVNDMLGNHPRIEKGSLRLEVSEFLIRLSEFSDKHIPSYRKYVQRKHLLLEQQKEMMRLDEYKPKIMNSFVRNKLIDTTYLPLIGANLAKQMGAYGDEKRTDLMGLLLLISPPGYGKTTLMEYIANRLGLIFMKINCPSIGHSVTSLDPTQAPNATAREEVDKLNLSLEMGNNVMIYLDDIQHTNPEFLQKFISLCDAQRKIEGVYRGKTRTYDLRGKRVSVVMAGNPYTESGEKFQIPDMLVNRADVYNLGDVQGGHEEAFALSYIENALTSNPATNKIATRSQTDVFEFVKIAKTGEVETNNFEANYSQDEIREIASIFTKLLQIQKVVLQVNEQYIYSAAQDETYRTEPKFLLQGSYRNMNKMVEKISPVMNEKELKQLIQDHYTDEAQLLTTGAEFNLLRFKEMMNWLAKEEKKRLQYIREEFRKNNALGGQEGEPLNQILGQVNVFNERFADLTDSLLNKNTRIMNYLETKKKKP